MNTLIRCTLPILLAAFLLAGCVNISAGTSAPTVGTTGSTALPTQSTAPTTIPTQPVPRPTIPTEPTTEPTTPPTEPPVTFPMRTVTDTALYPQPDTTAEGVISLSKASLVDTLDMGSQWASVLLDGNTYYVPAAHLREPNRYLIVIDAGHQRVGNLELEPDGPGSSTMKYKVSYGTCGGFTGIAEYILTLAVAEKLQQELQARGYMVEMVRTDHDVDISNAQRAQIANELYADAFIRLHANGSNDPSANGIMTICQCSNNPYNSHLYTQSRALSDAVLDHLVAATGARREYVWETNTMSGINWCQVPVTIVEMGYMTNETEDCLMATEEYRQLLALGIANGIDAFFAP